MFYCEPCRKKNEWPSTLFTSHGCCEVCRTDTNCYEKRSGDLPDRTKTPDRDGAAALAVGGHDSIEAIISTMKDAHQSAIDACRSGAVADLERHQQSFYQAFTQLQQMTTRPAPGAVNHNPTTGNPEVANSKDSLFDAIVGACEAEKINSEAQNEVDEAYNSGVEHCVDAIQNLRAKRVKNSNSGS